MITILNGDRGRGDSADRLTGSFTNGVCVSFSNENNLIAIKSPSFHSFSEYIY